MTSNIKRIIGAHLRLKTTYRDLVAQADLIGADAFQCLAIAEGKKSYHQPDEEDQLYFKKTAFQHYVHSSFRINISSLSPHISAISKKSLLKELSIAERLNIKHIIVHPGHATGSPHKGLILAERIEQGIRRCARTLNSALERPSQHIIVLENTAHGGAAIGSDFEHFNRIKQLLHTPDRIRFCLDIAHAFVYGYDVHNTTAFLEMVNATMGLNNICLIHLNDAHKPKESKIDEHALPGEGCIGEKALRAIINHPALRHVPIIIEAAQKDSDHLKRTLTLVRSWQIFAN